MTTYRASMVRRLPFGSECRKVVLHLTAPDGTVSYLRLYSQPLYEPDVIAPTEAEVRDGARAVIVPGTT